MKDLDPQQGTWIAFLSIASNSTHNFRRYSSSFARSRPSWWLNAALNQPAPLFSHGQAFSLWRGLERGEWDSDVRRGRSDLSERQQLQRRPAHLRRTTADRVVATPCAIFRTASRSKSGPVSASAVLRCDHGERPVAAALIQDNQQVCASDYDLKYGAGFLYGSKCCSLGWGFTSYAGARMTLKLQQASVTFVSPTVCAKRSRWASQGKNQGACNDGGGPLIVTPSESTYRLAIQMRPHTLHAFLARGWIKGHVGK